MLTFYKKNISLEWAIELYAVAVGYSNDPAIQSRLWQKIEVTRARLVALKKDGKEGSVSKYLLKNRWRKVIMKLAKHWANYTPYYYEKVI